MATTGWTLCGTGAVDTSAGSFTWGSPSLITAKDGSTSNTNSSANGNSYYLKGTNFGFSLPSNATVQGIEFRHKSRNFGGGFSSATTIYAVKGGTIGSTNKGTGVLVATLTEYTAGGASDLWGDTWTYSDINDSNFGFVLSISAINDGGQVDSFEANIHYILGFTYDESVTNAITTGQTTSAIKTMNEAHAGAAVAGYTINVTLDQYPAVTNALTGLGFSVVDDVGFVEDISAAVTPTMSIADVITFGTTLDVPVVVQCSIGDEFGKYRTVFLPRDVTWKNVRNNE